MKMMEQGKKMGGGMIVLMLFDCDANIIISDLSYL